MLAGIPTFPFRPKLGQTIQLLSVVETKDAAGTTNQNHNLKAMENIAKDLAAALPDVTEDFHLEYEQLLAQGASKNALRRTVARCNVIKCMSCPVHCKDINDLKKHIRKCKSYGVARLNEEKQSFINRLLNNHDALADLGIQVFSDVHPHYADFAQFEQREYEYLLFLTMLQIRLKR